MAYPREHPIDQLIETAEETARIMWRSYDFLLGHSDRSAEWQEKATALFNRCMACEERVAKLRDSRERIFGPKREDASSAGDFDLQDSADFA